MSKVFIHVQKEPGNRSVDYPGILEKLNLTNRPNKIIADRERTIGISAYSEAVQVDRRYLALGAFFPIPADACKFGSPIPDGVAAFFRFKSNGDIEVLTNSLASRTIWYYFDQSELIVSTSQRAIINILGNYEYDGGAAAWLLSSGNLGPGRSWDTRIKHLTYASSLTLDTERWQLSLHSAPRLRLENADNDSSPRAFEEVLTNSLDKVTTRRLKAAITLSGGYDSRFVLGRLRKNNPIDAFTWGAGYSLREKDTDGYVAKMVAEKNHVPFTFFDVGWESSDFDEFIKNFVAAGEARIDHLANFMDNFKMWHSINEMGYDLIVRSDEVFGWLPVADVKNVRLLLEMSYLQDFENFKSSEDYGLEKCSIPEEYNFQTDETLYSYRDRLFNIYRQTFVQPAIHDLFYPFVEMINPLFSNAIVAYARRLNDKQRTSKSLYIKAITNEVNYLPIAKRASYPKREYVLKSPEAVSYFHKLLSDEKITNLIPADLVNHVKENLSEDINLVQRDDSRLKAWVSENIPSKIRNFVRHNFRQSKLDFNLMAFRIGMIKTWCDLIAQDLKTTQK